MACLEGFSLSTFNSRVLSSTEPVREEVPLTPVVTGIFSSLFISRRKHSVCVNGEAILNKLNSFPQCAELIKKANSVCEKCKVRPLEIRLEHLTSGFAAEQEDNVLKIESSLPTNEKISAALYEIINLTQNDRFQKIEETLFQSAEEFAEAMEYVEYDSAKIFNGIIKNINAKRAKQQKSLYDNPFEHVDLIPFPEYYKNFLTEEHKDYHRNFWTQRQIEWSQAASRKRKDRINN